MTLLAYHQFNFTIAIGLCNMHVIFWRSCVRTTTLNIRRSKCINIPIYRNLYQTPGALFHHSNISKIKDRDDDNQMYTRKTDDNTDNKKIDDSKTKSLGSWTQYATQKYERFAEKSSHIIYDFDEEQKRLQEGIETKEEHEEELFLERGVTGVFDVEELIDLLREENAKDIVVIKVPREMKYVNYFVIVTSKSQRHINALSQLVHRVYKKKRNANDPFVNVEGKNTDWVALDMGNIALHIMTADMRESYDLETLWTVGPQYDEKCREEENQDSIALYDLTVNPLQNLSVSHLSTESNKM